jgi:hypothetical protein
LFEDVVTAVSCNGFSGNSQPYLDTARSARKMVPAQVRCHTELEKFKLLAEKQLGFSEKWCIPRHAMFIWETYKQSSNLGIPDDQTNPIVTKVPR